MIHLASWTLNLFGMFFILAAHEVKSTLSLWKTQIEA